MNQTYIGYDVSGMSFSNIVTRDNCVEGQGYCVRLPQSVNADVLIGTHTQNITSNACLPLQQLGTTCTADRECQSVSTARSQNRV